MSLEKINRGDEQTKSLDLVSENISKLRELFPEIVTEGKIDFKALQLLNKAIILQAPKKCLPNSIFIDRQDTVSPCKLTYFKLF